MSVPYFTVIITLNTTKPLLKTVSVISFSLQRWGWKNRSFHCSGPLNTTYKWPWLCGHIWTGGWIKEWENVHGTEPGKISELTLNSWLSAPEFLHGEHLGTRVCSVRNPFYFIIDIESREARANCGRTKDMTKCWHRLFFLLIVTCGHVENNLQHRLAFNI